MENKFFRGNLFKNRESIFTILILLTLLIEGVGLPASKTIAYYMLLLLPTVGSVLFFTKLKQLVFPSFLKIPFLLFSVGLFFSLFFAWNKQNHFEEIVSFTSLAITVMFVYTFREKLAPHFRLGLILLGIFLTMYSYALQFGIDIIPDQIQAFLIPSDGYQLVYRYRGNHNPLGGFLLISLIFLVSEGRRRTSTILLVLFFSLALIDAYSRSSLISLIIPLGIMVAINKESLIQNSKFLKLVTVYIPLLFLSILTVGTQEFDQSSIKSLLSNRDQYFSQAVAATISNPLFGVGGGNFELASKAYTFSMSDIVLTSHNLFLDFLAEYGIVTGVALLLIILILFLKSRFTQYFYASLALFIHFQLFYLYEIRSLFLLFFILLTLSLNGSTTFKTKISPIVIVSVLISCVVVVKLLSSLFLHNANYLASFLSYPLNRDAAIKLIETNKIPQEGIWLVSLLYPYDSNVQYSLANYYYEKDNKKALDHYERMYKTSRFNNIEVVKKLHKLKLEVDQKSSVDFANAFFSEYETLQLKHDKNSKQRIEINVFCQEVYEYACPFRL